MNDIVKEVSGELNSAIDAKITAAAEALVPLLTLDASTGLIVPSDGTYEKVMLGNLDEARAAKKMKDIIAARQMDQIFHIASGLAAGRVSIDNRDKLASTVQCTELTIPSPGKEFKHSFYPQVNTPGSDKPTYGKLVSAHTSMGFEETEGQLQEVRKGLRSWAKQVIEG